MAKVKDPVTGQFKTLYVKALDSLPVGSQIEFSGTDIPAGWEEVSVWKTLATNVAYNTATNLPSDFNELAVYVKLSTYDEIFSVNVVKPYINTTTRKQFTFGGEGYLVYANITNTQITEVGIIKNGTTQTSTTYDVYYK